MKVLQNSYRKSTQRNISLPIKRAVHSAIKPLQMQLDEVNQGWENLSMQVERINSMAVELEAAILELKAIASTLNGQRRYKTGKQEQFEKVCKYFPVSVPWLKQKANRTFVLTARKIDLFRSEREAEMLAQQLRYKSRRKKSSSQRHRKNRDKKQDSPKNIILKSCKFY
ncbi:MAG: hypothetical protein AAF378_10095 [Cyanobacteria bacterium P01_A01_bin.84]